MPKQPAYIKQYLPNGDYNLIQNPDYLQVRDFRPSRGIVRTRQHTLWDTLQKYTHNPKANNPLNCKCHKYNFEHVDKRTQLRYAVERILKFKVSLKDLSKAEKLKRLKAWAENEKIKTVFISYAKRRKFHDDYKYQWFKAWKLCFICELNPVEHIHHITQVQHGGTNDEGNLIGLCKDCHSDIHPWMKTIIQ